MPPSPSDFWKRLTDQRIASEQQCREWAAEIVTKNGPATIADARSIADALIASGNLTSYQASLLIEDVPVPITRGRFVLRSNLDRFPFRNWKVARADSDQDRWIYVFDVSQSQLESSLSNWPSVSRLQLQTKTHGSHLLPIEGFEIGGSSLIVVVAPIVGTCLSEKLPARGMAWQESIDVVQALASALQVLHDAGIVHGEVLLDRVWRKPDGSYLLLRDPMYSPRSPLGEQSLTCFESSNLVPCYAAPEFFVPGYGHTIQTDLYALGALWFHLLTGLPPFAKEPPSTRMRAITAKSLSIPKSIGLPTALRDCLAYLLSKNPSSRFQSITHFDEALRSALRLTKFEDSTEMGIEPPQVTSRTTTIEASRPSQPNDSVSPASGGIPSTSTNPQVPASKEVRPIGDEPSSTAAPSSTIPQVARDASSPSTPPNTTDSTPSKAMRKNAPVGDTGPLTSRTANTAKEVAKPLPPAASSNVTSASNREASKSPPTKNPANAPPTPPTLQSGTSGVLPADVAVKVTQSAHTPKQVTPAILGDSRSTAIDKSETPSVEEAVPIPKTPQTKPQLSKAHRVPPQQNAPEPAVPQKITPLKNNPPQPSPPTVTSQQGKDQQSKPRIKTLHRNSKNSGKRSQARKRPAWLLPSLVGGSLLLLAGLVFLIASRPSNVDRQRSQSPQSVNTSGSDTQNLQANGDSSESALNDGTILSNVFSIVDDENSFAWVPPFTGKSVSRELLPPGAYGFLFFRPEAWLDSTTGRSIIELFEPELSRTWQWIEEMSGLPAAEMDSIVVGLFPGEDGWPTLTYRFELKEGRSLSRMRELWSVSSEETIDKTKLLVGNGRYYFLPQQPLVDAMTVKQFAVGSREQMSSLAELGGAVATQRPPIAEMLDQVDSRYDLVIIFSPSFLHTDATQVLTRWFPNASSELEQILSNRARSCMIATQLSPQWYGEFRLRGESDLEAPRMIEDWKRRMRELPDLVEKSMVRNPPHEFWRALAMRFPQMIRSLARNQRYSVEQGVAITNFYLTEQAAPNVLLASWLAMQNPTNWTSDVAPSSKPKPRPWTPEEILARPISIAFDQESLEAALQIIAEEVNRDLPDGTAPLKFEIVNAAFERSGITRNQQVREFRHENKPLRSMLVDLALRVNPDRSVTSPKDPKLAVVWYLDADTMPGQPTVHFTTRIFAEEANQRIANEFEL